MAEHNELGDRGEELALGHLKGKGYSIRATNWRFGKNEIDIIAESNEYIVIVEVKTRRSNYMGEPELWVNKTKQRFLIRAANQYLIWNNIAKETRFDIISIILTPTQEKLKHIEHAFYPTM